MHPGSGFRLPVPMTPKLTERQKRRVRSIDASLLRVIDAITNWHGLIFDGGNRELVHHPTFKSLIRHKEAAIKHLLAAQVDIQKMIGDR